MKIKKILCGFLASMLVFSQGLQITSSAIYSGHSVYATETINIEDAIVTIENNNTAIADGNALAGDELTASVYVGDNSIDLDSNYSVKYTWTNTANEELGTGNIYTVKSGDATAGSENSITVTANISAISGSAAAEKKASITIPDASIVDLTPVIVTYTLHEDKDEDGRIGVGDILKISHDLNGVQKSNGEPLLEETEYTYQYKWVNGSDQIVIAPSGEDATLYTVKASDAGKIIKARIEFSPVDGSGIELTADTSKEGVSINTNTQSITIDNSLQIPKHLSGTLSFIQAPNADGIFHAGETLNVEPKFSSSIVPVYKEDYIYEWTANGEVITGVSNVSYQIREADRGKTIRAAIVAMNDEYTGRIGNEGNGITVKPAPPGVPTEFTAVAGNKLVNLSWVKPEDDGGADVTYVVTYIQSGSVTKEVSTDKTLLSVGSLTNAKEYTFYLQAENSEGKSETVQLTATPDTTYNITLSYKDADGKAQKITATTNAEKTLEPEYLVEPIEIDGFRFDGWYTTATGGTEVDEDHKFSANTTIYAIWKSEALDEVEYDIDDDILTAEIIPEDDTSGSVTTNKVDDKEFEAALQLAEDEKASNDDVDEAIVKIDADMSSKADTVRIELERESLTLYSKSKVDDLLLENDLANIHLDKTTVTTLLSLQTKIKGYKETDELTFEIKKVDVEDLTQEQEHVIGDRPVYSLKVFSGNDDDDVITDFSGKTITVVFHYELDGDEEAEDILVTYVDEDGEIEEFDTDVDEKEDTVTAEVDHFSIFFLDNIAQTTSDTSDWKNPFLDVFNSDWFYEQVKYVNQNGLFDGTSYNSFSPNSKMTRAMVVTVLWRLDSEPYVATTTMFNDVKSLDWYATAVSWSVKEGIASGTSRNAFTPNGDITREQLVTMLYRYAGGPTYSSDEYNPKDLDDISSWADIPMQWAISKGILTGYSDGTVKPQATATRAEVATILMRFDMKY